LNRTGILVGGVITSISELEVITTLHLFQREAISRMTVVGIGVFGHPGHEDRLPFTTQLPSIVALGTISIDEVLLIRKDPDTRIPLTSIRTSFVSILLNTRTSSKREI
jgi:hypothetical protein